MRKTIAGLAFSLPLLVAGAAYADGEGRYQMERTADGFVRLDTVTGEMSLCKEGTGQIACRMAADERAAFENELDRLTKRVEALEKAQRSALSVDKPRLPTDEEIDRTMGVMERMMQRFMDIVKNLEGGKDKTDPQIDQLPEKT
ncbi:hypothetical protein IB238_15065 [Rhizobium sp. ARZ01]|uniref:hypothetical protein n=1 Tax=Rhizobium sp. ARZ01 TaxID=2769313 RepID=UPI00177CBDCA|nr:hypothetical protein [Rhizobium sp. ARZ01]MBD9373943.1 hypothetical protein [Rhizobium sp. ARZ01]